MRHVSAAIAVHVAAASSFSLVFCKSEVNSICVSITPGIAQNLNIAKKKLVMEAPLKNLSTVAKRF